MQTYKRVFCAVAIALCAVPIAATAADIRACELFSTREIASVLGVMPERGQPHGPDVDKDLAVTDWQCVWSVGERYFVVGVVRFRSAADATRTWTKDMPLVKSSPEDDLQLSEVPGPGEQNLWGSSSGYGAIWVSRKGQTVLTVLVTGEKKRPESLREPLRDLLTSGLRRLP